jgi:mono/diheme cytochrome c family protein
MKKVVFAGVVAVALAIAQQRSGDFLDRIPPSAAARPNPYEGQRNAPLAGRKLYARHCAECHGREREGHGKAPPLAQPLVRDAAAGTLFRAITDGSLNRGMPSFAAIPEPQRWQIVTFLKGR